MEILCINIINISKFIWQWNISDKDNEYVVFNNSEIDTYVVLQSGITFNVLVKIPHIQFHSVYQNIEILLIEMNTHVHSAIHLLLISNSVNCHLLLGYIHLFNQQLTIHSIHYIHNIMDHPIIMDQYYN